MGKTDNLPPEWQEIVLDAIAQAQARREELEATGQLKDRTKILKEAYVKLVEQMRAAGVPEEEFIPEHHFYVASGLGRVLNWALQYSKQYPPTHRKGYGEESYEEITSPDPLIFFHGGGGHGGPSPGPGEPDWPDPEEIPLPDGSSSAPDIYPIIEHFWHEYNAMGLLYDRGSLLNDIALASGPDWGLSRKASGAHAIQPVTGERIGHDVLHWDPTGEARTDGRRGQLYDVLTDRGPVFLRAHPHNDPSRIWLPAVPVP